MPDISMCRGRDDCPLCKTCYRRTATPSGDRQSWFAEPPALTHTSPRDGVVGWLCYERMPKEKP